MSSLAVSAAPQFVYFGTYTRTPPSKGIYVARFDPSTGSLSQPALAAEVSNATFLARHPTLPILYAVASQKGAGVVIAYKINPANGELTLLNQVSDGENNGTYIAITPDGRTALTAHYSGGFLNSFPIRADGSLGEIVSHIQHTRTGSHPQQSAPHPHCIDVSPNGEFAYVADLAADQIVVYQIGKNSSLEFCPSENAPDGIIASLKPVSGVRHLAFTPDGRRLYAISELSATVTGYDYDSHEGSSLSEIETVSIVPLGFSGRRWASEIAVHPTGKFLYASNRADDESIAAFAIDPSTGKLTFVQRTGGLANPRHFTISPDGHWLVCANQDSNDVMTFSIDTKTGKLSEKPVARANVPTCVCVLFWPQTR